MTNKDINTRLLPIHESCSICIGLGHVGLPLAVQIAKTRKAL